jgi:hypothetical protein
MSNLVPFKRLVALGVSIQMIGGEVYVFESVISDLDYKLCRLIDAPIVDSTNFLNMLLIELSRLEPEDVRDV